jgi:hypothetical protein
MIGKSKLLELSESRWEVKTGGGIRFRVTPERKPNRVSFAG